jgi:hypothetical protein
VTGSKARRAGRVAGTGTSPGFQTVPLWALRPATLNNAIYKPVDDDDPATRELAESIRRTGVVDPLNVTEDWVIVSGHRRRAACVLAEVYEVPVRVLPILSTDPEFPEFLVRFNSQRVKTPAEQVREQVALTDPDDAYRAVLAHRAAAAKVKVKPLEVGGRRARDRISGAKRPFLDAVRRVLDDLRDYWPVSDRRVHYVLLNDPPLRHASKPASAYRNDLASYKDLTHLLTRARIAGLVPFEAIGDETRPVETWDTHPHVAPFVAGQIDGLLRGYWRDLMQGQPNHVEIVAEKMTLEATVRGVAAAYTIPYTVGRGYSSLPPRKAMYDRYRASGKDKLVILFLADFDPEGWDIPQSFARSMQDDFGVEGVHPVRVGLNPGQVRRLGLPRNADAKVRSSRYPKFVERFGPAVYELDAVPVPTLQGWLREAINRVIDVAAFNRQVDRERQDAATLDAYRRAAVEYLKALPTDGTGTRPGFNDDEQRDEDRRP